MSSTKVIETYVKKTRNFGAKSRKKHSLKAISSREMLTVVVSPACSRPGSER